MQVAHAVLGLLAFGPMTGYDMKKVMQKSPFIYWSGNNNQIYKALTELKDEGFVISKSVIGEDSPTKKEYEMTSAGRSELKRLSSSYPEIMEMKKPFLVQLAWAHMLKKEQILSLIDSYEKDVFGAYKLSQPKEELNKFNFESGVQQRLWELIYENIEAAYNAELDWIEKLRNEIKSIESWENTKIIESETNKMKYEIVKQNNAQYIKLLPGGKKIDKESDAIDVVTFCAEGNTNMVLIPSECVSDDFFRLSTRIAGLFFQKLTNYKIKCAILMDVESAKGKFREFISESNRGQSFRAYSDIDDVHRWFFG